MPPVTDNSIFPNTNAVVKSEAMQRVMRLVQRVAPTNAVVLLTGESGVGKEVVARALHQFSLRCSKPWVDLNCAALPEHLIESELFGHEKGAFSGADSLKAGMFELAHTGTIFLDEIGDLDPKMQVKLLRVLDGTPYYRLGGTRKVSVDVRVIAATNQNLEEAIGAGRFRSDLYHRISQIKIEIPSLRERNEDIMAIANFFLQEYNSELRFTAAAIEALEKHAWPGNVRELKNVIAKVALLADGLEIRVADLPAEIQRSPLAKPSVVPVASAGPVQPLEIVEKQVILQALAQTEGHQQKAAKLLGISRRTLHRKLKTYGFDHIPEPIPTV